MKDTYDHIRQTVDQMVEQGLIVSLNALFQAYYSPDFCREQGLHNLNADQLAGLMSDIQYFKDKYGPDGPVHYMAFEGQVENLQAAKESGDKGPQVVLGAGGHAPRKGSVKSLYKDLDTGTATREVMRRVKRRITQTIGG